VPPTLAPPLPSSTEFARLLAEYLNARDHALETKALDDHKAAEALWMKLIESSDRVASDDRAETREIFFHEADHAKDRTD